MNRILVTRRTMAVPVALFIVLLLVGMTGAPAVQAVSPDIVISQIYGGGGNSGAPFQNDFIELFNRGTTTVSLGGWSVQYTSATGAGNFGSSSTLFTPLAGVLAPGQYLLIQEASNAPVGSPLPTPDVTDSTPIAMSATGGKVALVNTTTPLGCNGGSTPCSPAALATIVDLIGYDGANFFEGAGPAPTLSNTTAAFRANGGCTDTDNNNSDFSAAPPAPRNTASPLNPCPTGINLSINDVSANEGNAGTTSFDFTVNLSAPALAGGVTFDIATSDNTATSPEDFTAVSLTGQTISAGSSSYTFSVPVNGDTTTEPDETFFVNVTNITGASAVDAQGQGTIVNDDVCDLPYTPIYQIQGTAFTTTITGTVTTRGVVIGDYEGASPTLRGFYLQDAAGDGDTASSDGIFVFNGNNNNVNLGDVVRVTGNAAEFQDQTQIGASQIINCGSDSVAPVDVMFPLSSTDFLERYEGMLVRLPQTLYVTEHFQLGRFGQVVMSADARLKQPTHVVAPGAPANALQAANNLNRIIVDDELQNQNRDPILFGRGGNPLSASNTLRGGDTATGIVGIMTYTWAGNAASGNAYRVRPINALGGGVPDFQPTNPRPTSPDAVGGTLRVASLNLLNFFNTFDGIPDTVDNCTFGVGGAPADCRGADTQAEFDRQYPKTVAAILAIDPDILAVNEIENDGYGPSSAIRFLTDQLNAATAPGTYAFIDVDANTGQVNALGTDAIKVGMLYKPARVTPIGQTAALNSVAFVNGGDSAPRSRPSLAQAFQTTTGARFIVDANHFKSKGSACDLADQQDGQGNCNQVRVNAANELANWLATDPTGISDDDVLIIGDLNSYAQEDPITALKNAGYTNLIEQFIGADAYSFVFDGQWGYLDHALASDSLLSQVTGVTEYHINADEPNVLDYNTDFKSANLQNVLYAPDQYRVSDHDAVIVGLNLGAFAFDGFYPPIDNLPVVNVARAGSTIPVKFSLGGDFGLDVFAAGFPKSRQYDCGTSADTDRIEDTLTAGQSGLSYDSATGQYTYAWKTDKAWAGTCRRLIIRFADGTVARARFQFR